MNKQGKIKTFSFISLDGYVSKVGGGLDWLLDYPLPEGEDYGFGKFKETIGCAVTNGILYATLQTRDLWPPGDITTHVIVPHCTAIEAGAKLDYILLRPERNFGYVEAVEEIRSETDGDVWLVGDHEMLSLFMRQGLIDEMVVNILPVTLGNGCPMFKPSHAEHLWRLEEHNSYANGVMQMRYNRI